MHSLLRAVLALRLAAHGQQLRRIVDELRAANPGEAWNYFAIDLGAGVRDADPVFDLFRLSPAVYAPTNPRQPPSQPWFGVMVDGDPRQLAKMEAAFPAEDVAKRVAWIEPHTVVATLEAAAAPLTDRWRTPDVLKMDIDSFDCAVMRAVLRELAPKVVAMEINVKFPPDVSFALLHNRSADRAPFDSERRRFAYGCSLRFQARHLMPPFAGQQKRAKFPTSKAPISAVFHSFRLIFGRAIISRNGLEAWMCFPERARAEHSR